MDSKFEMTPEEELNSVTLGFALATQAIAQINNGVSVNTMIHLLAVNLGGVICEKYHIISKNPDETTDKIIASAIRIIQQNAEYTSKPSSN